MPNWEIKFKNTEHTLEDAWNDYATKKRAYKAAQKRYEKTRSEMKILKTPPSSDGEI